MRNFFEHFVGKWDVEVRKCTFVILRTLTPSPQFRSLRDLRKNRPKSGTFFCHTVAKILGVDENVQHDLDREHDEDAEVNNVDPPLQVLETLRTGLRVPPRLRSTSQPQTRWARNEESGRSRNHIYGIRPKSNTEYFPNILFNLFSFVFI